MKKLTKFLSYSAIIASAVFIVSCSDDVVDSNTTKDSGIPFRVNATVNNSGTRASDITSLSNFQIWGFLGDETNELAGVNCTPATGGGYNPATSVNWPVAGTPYTFYAISNNASSVSNNVLFNDNPYGFKYTMPYTIDENSVKVVDVKDQEDLLVATAQGNSSDGLTLNFDHAFAVVSGINLKLTPSYTPHMVARPAQIEAGQTPADYMFTAKVNKIVFHNIRISGNYAMGTGTVSGTTVDNGSWNSQVAADAVGDVVLDLSSNPKLYQCRYDETINDALDLSDYGGKLYFIPQTIDSYYLKQNDGTGATDMDGLATTTKNYMTIECITGAYPYDEVLGYLSDFVRDNEIPGLEKVETSEGSGLYDYYYTGPGADNPETARRLVMDHTGKVHDFDFFAKDEILTSSIDPGEPYIYNEADDTSSANGIKNYNHNTYGIMYKMFSLSSDFAVNGNRILNIELANGVRIDGAGAYGSVIEVE